MIYPKAVLALLMLGTMWTGTLRTGTCFAADKPNILFMLTDDQRWDAIGLGGSKHLKTPNMDRLAPSLLELCGAPALENIQGKSWVKLVREGDDTWRKSFLYYYNYEEQFPYTPNVRSVRTETWKYTCSPHGDGGPDRDPAELYNIEFDPEERHNLAANPKYTGVVKDMQGELLRVMKEVGLTPENDKMPLDEGIKSELPDQKIR